MAVANDSEVKIFDFSGNEIGCICFDRQILALEGYENLLSIVFHEGIPMWGCQCISMQLYCIHGLSMLKISESHIPIRPQSTLKWFGFSQEGMIFSQDSEGFLRAFNF